MMGTSVFRPAVTKRESSALNYDFPRPGRMIHLISDEGGASDRRWHWSQARV